MTDTPASRLTHVRADGSAHMVDVSAKEVTVREASAAGRVLVSPKAIEALRGGGVPKGDALAVARVAGHPGGQADARPHPAGPPDRRPRAWRSTSRADEGVEITATVRTADRTGIEMEALTAVSVAALASSTWSRRSTSTPGSPISG